MFTVWIRRILAGDAFITVAAGAVLAAAPVGAAPADAAPSPPSGVAATTARTLSIPDSALLQPIDLAGGIPEPADGIWPALQPPQPCARSAGYPSAAARRAQRSIVATVDTGDIPAVLVEYLAVYRADGAARYLRELRLAMTRCTGYDEDRREWTLLASGIAGEESLLLRLTEQFDYRGGAVLIKDTYVGVARVGRAVVVLADLGWQTSGGDEPLVREKIIPAVRRATKLLHGGA